MTVLTESGAAIAACMQNASAHAAIILKYFMAPS